jgi:uncharacterized coiled-coil protein SlyX
MQAVDAPQASEDGDAAAQRVDAEGDAEDVDIDSLVNVVLDSTKVSNHSAAVAAESTERMAAAVEKLSKISTTAHTRSIIALSVTALLMLAMVLAVFLISINLGSRFSQADTTLMAIGRRLVDIKGSLETVGKVENTLSSARTALQEDREMTRKLEARLDALMEETKRLRALQAEKADKAPDKGFDKVLETRNQALTTQIKALEAQLQIQAKAVTKLSEQLTALQTQAGTQAGVNTELKRGIDSLLEMEKKRATAPAPKPVATPAPAPAPAAAPAPRPAPRPAARVEPKAEIKVEVKTESRPEARPEPKPAATPPRENSGPVRDGLVRYPPAPSDLPARNGDNAR